MPNVQAIDFIYIFTTDFERSVAFYRDVLGLIPGKTYVRVPGMEFDAGNVTIVVVESAAVGIEFTPNTHPIAFRVENVAAEQSRLESLGVHFTQSLDTGVCHMALFDDPDGNRLMLHLRYADEDAD